MPPFHSVPISTGSPRKRNSRKDKLLALYNLKGDKFWLPIYVISFRVQKTSWSPILKSSFVNNNKKICIPEPISAYGHSK